MNILVCIKPVPDPEKYNLLQMDTETKTLKREGIPTVINPSDKNALEEAIKIREAYGGRITILSMAPEFSKNKLVEGLAMGADEAYLISDRAFGGGDTYATSYVLSEAVKRIALRETEEDICGETADGKALSCGFDLILAGNESADGATAHVPAQLAEWLGLPHICNVNRIELITAADTGECELPAEDGVAKRSGGDNAEAVLARVWKKTEDGRQIFEGTLPALVSVSRDINKPRLISAMGIIKAKQKPLTVLSNEQLRLDEQRTGLRGSPTQMGEMTVPDLSRKAAALGSDAEEVAAAILSIIKKAGA